MSLQSEAVHQCVVKLPLDSIISERNLVLVKEQLKEQVEKLGPESFPEAMEISDG